MIRDGHRLRKNIIGGRRGVIHRRSGQMRAVDIPHHQVLTIHLTRRRRCRRSYRIVAFAVILAIIITLIVIALVAFILRRSGRLAHGEFHRTISGITNRQRCLTRLAFVGGNLVGDFGRHHRIAQGRGGVGQRSGNCRTQPRGTTLGRSNHLTDGVYHLIGQRTLRSIATRQVNRRITRHADGGRSIHHKRCFIIAAKARKGQGSNHKQSKKSLHNSFYLNFLSLFRIHPHRNRPIVRERHLHIGTKLTRSDLTTRQRLDTLYETLVHRA